MAMARRSSLAPLFLLLLSVLVSGAAAARTVADSVQVACSKSQFPKICADGLTATPESQADAQKATPRRLAELFAAFAAGKGAGMGASQEGKASTKDPALLKCFDACGDDVDEAMAHLNGLIREPTDGKFLELKSWLASTLGGTSTCEDACKDAPKSADKDEIVGNSLEFEKLLRVTLDLITEASGSMSADIALPPSDAAAAPAYGAAAPFGGVAAPSSGSDASPSSSSADAPASSSSADAPAAAAEGPAAASKSYGGGASGPAAADSPAAAADAPSSGEASSAPAPSGSSAADADAPAGDSADAPAPGSDETAPDDDANDTKKE
jgi:pectinesterase inhibitor-like protein